MLEQSQVRKESKPENDDTELDRFTSEEYAKWRKYNEAQKINTGYDQSNISTDQKKVLDDAVSARAGLACDPLHSDCPKK